MNDNVTRLDMETKVALMAAFLYISWDGKGGGTQEAVEIAVELEQLAHRRVGEIFRERKLSRSEE